MALVVRDNTSCIPQGLSSSFVSSKRVYFEPGGYLQTLRGPYNIFKTITAN